MPVPHDYPFDASSPVGRYWLVHGVGFTVCGADGRELGVVEEVVVDPVRQFAEQVIVRRPGLLVRRRHATIAAGAVLAVSPASRRFVVGSPGSQAGGAPAAGRAIRRAGVASGLLVGALLRRLAAGLIVAGHLLWRGARAVARAAVAVVGRARRETPGLLRALGTAGLSAARSLAAGARIAGRVLGELTVLAAVLVAAAWRRAAASASPRETTTADEGAREDAPQWRNDADAPLSRETEKHVGPAPVEARRSGRRVRSGRSRSGQSRDRG